MNALNDKYSKITFGLLVLSMISFPPMSIYLIYKMIRNTNIDYLDNYLSVKKCAQCFLAIPGFFTIFGLLGIGLGGFESYISAVSTLWCYYGIFAIIFFIRASKMKQYNRYFEELYEDTVANGNPFQGDSFENNTEEEFTYREEVNVEYKLVICDSCGAKKQIVIGRKAKCDYCDSPLEAVV